MLFQTSKETVLFIKLYQEIRIPHSVTYLSVPIPTFQNGLYKSPCVRERETPKERQRKNEKEREPRRASASKRGRARETSEREKEKV